MVTIIWSRHVESFTLRNIYLIYHVYVPFALITISSCVLCSFMTYNRILTRVTRRVSLAEEELLTLPKNLSSSTVCSVVRVVQSFSFLSNALSANICLLVSFLLAILSFELITTSDYSFDIFKLLLVQCQLTS